MAAFLVRTGRRESLPWLHVGWIAALLLGGLTWVISSKLIAISGAHREVTEGITALVAAGLLLYVGFWLHSKANAARWSEFIKSQMTTALSGGALFSIALVSFLAVYREVFETVLFYQALWVQSEGSGQTAVIAGFAIGVAALAVLAWLIARFSVRLPLGTFFAASSVLLAIMAVVFAGQGIAALQEAGKLASNRIDFPSIPLLGIYPNLQGLISAACAGDDHRHRLRLPARQPSRLTLLPPARGRLGLRTLSSIKTSDLAACGRRHRPCRSAGASTRRQCGCKSRSPAPRRRRDGYPGTTRTRLCSRGTAARS